MKTPRFNLPPITFCEKSAAQIEADFLANYKALTGQVLAKADPRRIFAQSIIAIVTQQRANIDYGAKRNLLGYADNDDLDHLGVLTDTARLEAARAITTLRFTLSTTFIENKSIPSGTEVTAGDGVIWETTELLTIDAGLLSGTIQARCQTVGAAGNGYYVGEINSLVNPIPYVASVANTTESDGGVDAETDDPYAERIHLAPEKFSVAGPDGAYEFWAKTASQSIVDVAVRSPSPGVVEIRPLLTNGVVPGQEILTLVEEALTTEVVPLTDQIQVLAPEQVAYTINLTYYIHSNDKGIADTIQAAVLQAIEDYRIWQRSKLGRDVDPSELIYRVKNAGAKRVVVTQPAYAVVQSYQVASEGAVVPIYGGLEDE